MADDNYYGEISMFACNYAPRFSMFCAGQTLNISQFTTLFALLGTTYGGDGISTFKLPDLKGRAPVHKGARPGGSYYRLGEFGGFSQVKLPLTHLPSHTHNILVSEENGTKATPENNFLSTAKSRYDTNIYTTANHENTDLNPGTIGFTGALDSSQSPIELRSPYTTINYVIWFEGIWPPRT